LYDYTLAKIVYTPGVSPSIPNMLRIAAALEEAGVRDELLNVHSWGDPDPDRAEFELTRAVLTGGFSFRKAVFCEATREITDVLRELGADSFQYRLHVPQVVTDRGALDREIEQLAKAGEYANSLGASFVIRFTDAGRSDFETLASIANQMIEIGATRINMSDSYSSLSVDGMRHFCSSLRRRLAAPVELSVHAHNDFGLASAVAVAAATVGVNPEVSVNGISYRGGFPALEEVATVLEIMYGVQTGLRLDHFQRLSDLVSDVTGLTRHPSKPITGVHMFLRDNPDAQLAYLTRGQDVFPMPNACVAPLVVGGRFRIVWGTRQSREVIRAKVKQLGLSASDEQIVRIQEQIESVRASLTRYPQWVTEDQVDRICHEVVART
jgi:D-citramalate synthase